MVVYPTRHAPGERATATSADPWLRPVLLANLVGQVGIVVTGGLVRLTGSGLGCPTWPQCTPGSYTPVVTQPEGIHKDIEFGNRLLTFVVGSLALAALVVIVAHLRRGGGTLRGRRRLRLLGAFPLAGVAAQAALGGATVHTELHPAVVAAHFLLSMVLIAGSTILLLEATDLGVAEADATEPGASGVHAEATGVHAEATGVHAEVTGAVAAGPAYVPHTAASAGPLPAAKGGDPSRRPQAALRWLAVAVGVVASVVLVLGTVVTGSGPHSGDAKEPARFGFDPAAVSWLHADAVWLFVGLVVALLIGLHLSGPAPRALRRTRILLAVTLAQGVVGYAQYFTDLPIALVALHMLGASLLVIATAATLHAVLSRPVRRTAPA